MSFFISTTGKYLGQLNNGLTDILVVAADNPVFSKSASPPLSSSDLEALLYKEQSTPLVENSEKHPGYQKVLKIKPESWAAIKKAGGQQIIPVLFNKSKHTVFVKPETRVFHGPGAILDHRIPIAVAPGEMIFGGIDGVNTPWKAKKVFKAVDGVKMVVLPEGKIKVVAYANMKCRIGQLLIGGWRKMRNKTAWVGLMEAI